MNLFKEHFIKRGLIWSTIYVLYIIISGQLLLHFRFAASRTFNPLPHVSVITLMPLLFGILLKLPELIERWDSSNNFNWSKFINQGIPAIILVILSSPLFYMTLFRNIVPSAVSRYLIYDTRIIFLAAVWLGVVITDSIKGSPKV